MLYIILFIIVGLLVADNACVVFMKKIDTKSSKYIIPGMATYKFWKFRQILKQSLKEANDE